MMLDCVLDALLDCGKLIPFLFVTYIVIEWLEHRVGATSKNSIRKAGVFGPIIGALFGVVPQCGFSTVAANLYAGRVISLGTMLAVFLSTSDEMLPIFLSESVSLHLVIKILVAKCLLAMVAGLIVDVVWHFWQRDNIEAITYEVDSEEDCEHCRYCSHDSKKRVWGILLSALKHTLEITLFLFLISVLLNIVMEVGGEEVIAKTIGSVPILACFLSALVGLIPNCAASVVITQLYLEHVISVGAMFSGLLVGAGVGLLVFAKANRNKKDTIKVIGLLYSIGVIMGLIMEQFSWLFS